IRYADDFIIGIKGEYNQAERIKDQVTQWLKQDLNLTVSKDKSLLFQWLLLSSFSQILFCRYGIK
ncbi:MAG: hypothetical protein Q8807_03845, partial ['Waltheria sp.' little leaf phytoplasma]|nr:hypothetical protein ['Waltheria sp.' little leaf phytoplasma]